MVNRKPTGDPPGPKPKIIDWKEVDQYLEAGCNGKEIAARLGINPDTLYDRCVTDKKVSFSHYSQEKRASGDSLLRAAQMKVAMKGNTSMLIWLGKNRLGQSDTDKNIEQLYNTKAAGLINAVNVAAGVKNEPNGDEPEAAPVV